MGLYNYKYSDLIFSYKYSLTCKYSLGILLKLFSNFIQIAYLVFFQLNLVFNKVCFY